MKYLYRLMQDDNNGYETFDSAIVCAGSEEEAKTIEVGGWGREWANSPDSVHVELIGTALDDGCVGDVLLASFNAG